MRGQRRRHDDDRAGAPDDAEQWQRDIDVNLTGAFRTVQACLGGMRERRLRSHRRDLQRRRRSAGLPGQVAYAASKAGQLGMVRTLAGENAAHGITVNAVLPGLVATEQVLAMPADGARARGRVAAVGPAGRARGDRGGGGVPRRRRGGAGQRAGDRGGRRRVAVAADARLRARLRRAGADTIGSAMDEAGHLCERAATSAADLDVIRHGEGPRVVLVHGSVVGAARTWSHQLALAQRWELVLPNRPGFGDSLALARGDFAAEAPLIAELLGDGAHLVGHSYGAVIALYAAALRPDAVRSLTISEPGCMRVAAGDAAVDAQIAAGELLYERGQELSPLDFLRAFRGGVGSTHETPAQLGEELLHGARLCMRERPPWEADPPLQALRSTSFPKLVISGGHSRVVQEAADARQRRVFGQQREDRRRRRRRFGGRARGIFRP